MKIGDAVEYFRYQKDGYVCYAAILLSLPDAEGRAQLFYYHPDRSRHLGGADWRDAIDRAIDVLPEGKQGEQISYYRDTEAEVEAFISALKAKLAATTESKDAALQALADEGAKKLPSAAVLDATEEEKKIAEATSTKVRQIKGK